MTIETTGTLTPAQEALKAMRRCGHQLHHNMRDRDISAEEVLACLSTEEQAILRDLLCKCLSSWTPKSAE